MLRKKVDRLSDLLIWKKKEEDGQRTRDNGQETTGNGQQKTGMKVLEEKKEE